MDKRDELVKDVLARPWAHDAVQLLRDDAESWWYHKQLRKEGDVAEAKKREDKSVNDALANIGAAITNGGYGTIAQSGHTYTLTFSDNKYRQGYSPDDILAAYVLGIPILDFRNVAPYDSRKVIRMSMPVLGDCKFKVRDAYEEWVAQRPGYPTSMSYVPLAVYFRQARKVGATVHYRPTPESMDDQYLIGDDKVGEWFERKRAALGLL